MSMTRQEQLDQVVRNYGEWEGDLDFPFVVFEGDDCHYIADEGPFSRGDGGTMYAFTRAEVEQRKAELQNKPSWDDAPEGANILIQTDEGVWFFGTYHDAIIDSVYSDWNGIGSGKWMVKERVDGEVIGDWRDTLEKRPKQEVTPEEEEAFNMLEARNGECIGGSLTDDGRKWNGEGLPPVGVWCEFLNENREWTCCVRIGIAMKQNKHVIETDDGKVHTIPLDAKFRPIKSSREKWCDSVMSEIEQDYTGRNASPKEYVENAVGQIYDAFKSGKLKLPEVD